MFAGFSEKTGGFLWELAFHNERPWFLAHKQEFEDFVNTPFKALAADSIALMNARFPDFQGAVHLSRIYRDARRLFGRGPYKDHLWFTAADSQALRDGPTFWFEIAPSSYSFGMGFYAVTPAQMEAFRRSIDANPTRFLRLARLLERKGWTPSGEPYKRPKKLHGDVLLDDWYNRRWAGAEKSFDWGGPAYTPALPGILVDAWAELMPMYLYLMEVYRACPREKDKRP
jgi:uncharacterized protein (TIGR02453 family)